MIFPSFDRLNSQNKNKTNKQIKKNRCSHKLKAQREKEQTKLLLGNHPYFRFGKLRVNAKDVTMLFFRNIFILIHMDFPPRESDVKS